MCRLSVQYTTVVFYRYAVRYEKLKLLHACEIGCVFNGMARTLENILGDHVMKQNGEKVAVSSLCGKDRILGIYFSAEWCPPSKGFTPKLVELYKKLKARDGVKFEVVFVSWDRDESSFTEYFNTHPWLALPFGSDRKAKLCKKFRVHGIPKLVLVDAENCKTITCEGYNRVKEDEGGSEFPWRRKKFTDIIKGNLLKQNKDVDAIEELSGKIVGLYFAANWCPPCKGFTHQLIGLYEKLNASGKKFEVVFASMDRSGDSFTAFANSMPWLAIPFNDPRSQMLKSLYEVDGIPMLVMLDETGCVITLDGRLAINEDIDGQTDQREPRTPCVLGTPDRIFHGRTGGDEFPWYPKPIIELTEGEAIQLNESACLVLFVEPDDEEVDKAREILLKPATEELKKGELRDLLFFIGADDEICDPVRHFANLGEQTPLLTILDLPEQKVYISEEKNITTELVNKFVNGYLDGTLPSRPCRR